MKKSFFKDYYLYRLRDLRGFFIASCILSFLSGPLLLTGLAIVQSVENINNTGGQGAFYTLILGLYVLAVTAPALILLGMIIPIVTRRHLNRKAYVDTFEALPLTYKQRYWGDLLSELTAYAAPVAVCGIYIMIAVFAYSNNEYSDILYSDIKQTQDFLSSTALTLVFSCIGGLALSNLIAQCSGKVGSGIMYSVLTAFLLPMLVLIFGAILATSAIGIDEVQTAADACLAIPPIGWIFKLLFSSSYNFFRIRYAVSFPILFGILLAIIAAFIVGGYFIGKKRKPELVGESLMFETAYRAVSICIGTAVISYSLGCITNQWKASNYIVMLVVTFIIFMAFELLQKGRKIKIVGALIRYVCVCAAGLGFFALMRSTNGLGAEDYLPKPDSVSEVSISSGSRWWDNSNEYVFDDKNAVKIVIDQHKDILKSKDDLSTGDDLIISYKLKNGLEIARTYSIKDTRVTANFIKPLVYLPQKGNNPLNLLRDESIEFRASISKNYNFTETSDDPDYAPDYLTDHIVKPEKISELRRLLISDIENNFQDFFTQNSSEYDSGSLYGTLRASYFENGQQHFISYIINKNYSKTIAFLENPDNLTTALTTSLDSESVYSIQYDFDGGSFTTRFSASDNDPLPPELYALFTTEKPGEEYSERFIIHCYDDLGMKLFIRKSDEKRAAEIFLNAVKNDGSREDAHFYSKDKPEDQLL